MLQAGVDMLDIRNVEIGDEVGFTLTDDTAVVTRIAGAVWASNRRPIGRKKTTPFTRAEFQE